MVMIDALLQVQRVGVGPLWKVRGHVEEGHSLSGVPSSWSVFSELLWAYEENLSNRRKRSLSSGSAKTHERSGCVFCKSERFCSPQDYDSRCPCDWHRIEHTRQASSIEANIRRCVSSPQHLTNFNKTHIRRITQCFSLCNVLRKTLACERFPFTEVSCLVHYGMDVVA